MAKHAIDDLAVIISASTEQLAGDLRAAARMFGDFQKDVAKANAAAPPKMEFAGLKSAASAIRGIASYAKDAAASVASIAAKAVVATATFGAMQAGAMGISAGFEQAREAVNMAADIEQTTLAFEVMLKSADGAKKMLGEIRQFAATTPFNSKELTESARMLIAYGASADQVIPTLRMLGDVSAGMGKDLPIRDLTYLYGTLQAQGRAYTKDINQFTNRGVDVLPNLSKELGVTTAEVMKLVEEGRVGFPEVVKAFKAMTGEGGRFEGMTKRQSKTFAGLRESAFDAFDLMKTKFGQVVIDEFGLKDAARDFESFAKTVTERMDSVRPAIRFVGDAVKGVVQGTYELAKAGAQIGGGIFAQLGAGFPGIRDAVESLRRMIADAQNFKFNKAEVIRFGVAVGEVLITTVARAIDAIAGVIDSVATFGDALYQNIAAPLIRAVKDIGNAIKDVRALTGGKLGFPMHPTVAEQHAINEKFALPFTPVPDAFAPKPGDAPESILKRYAMLSAQTTPQPGMGVEQARGAWHDAQAQMDQFRKAFADPAAAHAELLAGRVPKFRDQPPAAGSMPGGERPSAKLLGPLGLDIAAMKAKGRELIASAEQEAQEAMEDAAKKLADETRNAADALAQFSAAMRGPGGAAGFHELAAGIGRIEQSYGGFNARIFRTAFDEIRRDKNEVRVPGGPSTQLLEFVNAAKDDFDPTRKLIQERKLLDQAAQFKLLSRDEIDAAWTRKVRGIGHHLGIGGPPQLADAVNVGSAEDARLLARHQVGEGPLKMADFLQAISETLKRMEKQDAAANRHGVRLLGVDW